MCGREGGRFGSIRVLEGIGPRDSGSKTMLRTRASFSLRGGWEAIVLFEVVHQGSKEAGGRCPYVDNFPQDVCVRVAVHALP